MIKLLSAEFVRLWKSMVFKLSLLFSAGMSAFMVFARWYDVKMDSEYYAQRDISYRNADGLIFGAGIYLFLAIAVLVAIFIGTEYSDGTIRNKLIVGHIHRNIYLSKFVVCVAATTIVCILNVAVTLALGMLFINGTTLSVREILFYTGVELLAMWVLSAIFLMISMSIHNKAIGSVVCLLLTIAMFMTALTVYNRLEATEYYTYYEITETDGVPEAHTEKNPHYLTGTKRKVYEFINDFLPASQLSQVAQNDVKHIDRIIIYDGLMLVITAGVGIMIFKKRNLK